MAKVATFDRYSNNRGDGRERGEGEKIKEGEKREVGRGKDDEGVERDNGGGKGNGGVVRKEGGDVPVVGGEGTTVEKKKVVKEPEVGCGGDFEGAYS